MDYASTNGLQLDLCGPVHVLLACTGHCTTSKSHSTLVYEAHIRHPSSQHPIPSGQNMSVYRCFLS
jgi:hypothetical protein